MNYKTSYVSQINDSINLTLLVSLLESLEAQNSGLVLVRFKDVACCFIDCCIIEYKNKNYIHPELTSFLTLLEKDGFTIDSCENIILLISIHKRYKEQFSLLLEKIIQDLSSLLDNMKHYLNFIFIDFDAQEIQTTVNQEVVTTIKILKGDIEKHKRNLSLKTRVDNNCRRENNKNNGIRLLYLINELKHMYSNAPNGYQMSMIHLFAIKYAKELKKYTLKTIAILATGKASFATEISKGINLANFVSIKESANKYFSLK